MITDMKAYQREYYQEHKEKAKDYYQEHKEDKKAYQREYYQEHKEDNKAYSKAYYQKHKEDMKAYQKADVNLFGKPKSNIRRESRRFLKKHGTKIPGYQIHHCFTYDDHKKFIYCSREKHLEIHQFLRDNKIEPDTNHYEQIKHLLDDTVIVYGL